MKILAAIMVILALVIGIVPQFTDCESHGRTLTLADGRTVPMKCHWTARAEWGLAFPLITVGVLDGITRKKETIRFLSLASMILGVMVILLPTALIGVCSNPEMICNSVMKPTLILSGSVVILLGALGLVNSFRGKELNE